MFRPAVLLDPDDPVVADAAAAGRSDAAAAARLTRALGWASLGGPAAVTDPLADHLLDRVLDHEGPFAAAAERLSPEQVSPLVVAAAVDDLRGLQLVVGAADRAPVPALATGMRADLKRAVAGRPDWGDGLADLAAYFRRFGAGRLGRHRVFRWQHGLVGVDDPDPISLDDLVSYEVERGLLEKNLDAFVSGRPANNALLYGDRGAGKSSTVKALAASHPLDRLRLLEITREQLAQFPEIVAHLRHRPARFLLFIDDLSFEEGEVHYAALKSVLEGGVEAQPANVLLYATSNRRHLVRELRSDREGDGEVHVAESFQEKLSLSDRFGLRVLFLAPDQPTYLEVCRAIAARRGLAPGDEFDRAALLWCRRHNARSCRTARQFVDDWHGRSAS